MTRNDLYSAVRLVSAEILTHFDVWPASVQSKLTISERIVWPKLIRLSRFGAGSRILRGSPAFFVLSRNFAVTYAYFGYFCVNLPDFQHSWVDFGHFWADFEHFLTTLISRFSVNGSDSQ